MAQQFIDFGTFPNDPTADPIRAAFQKIQDNFTDIYNATASSGVTSLTVGAGLSKVGGTTGNILIFSNIPSITIQTGANLLVGVGTATTTTATISTYTTPFKIDLAPNIAIANANFSGMVRTSNLQVANFVSSVLVPNANAAYDFGTSSLRWKDLYLSGNVILGGQSISGNALSFNVANLNVNDTTITSNLTVTSTITLGTQTINADTANVILANLSATSNIYASNVVIGTLITTPTANITGNLITGNLGVTTVNTNLIPFANTTYDLGNSTLRWRSLSLNTGVSVGAQTITSNALGFIVSGNTYLAGITSVNASLGNAVVANYLTLQSNLSAGNSVLGNRASATFLFVTSNLSVTGNSILGNLATANYINVASNVISGNASLGNLVTANYVNLSNDLSVTGNGTVGNVSVTGNLTTGNLSVIANITVGNITGPYSNGTSNINIPVSNGNILMSVNGTANIVTVATTGVTITTPLIVNNLINANGQSQFWNGIYTDPDTGVTRAIKVGNRGIAVLGGTKTDTLSVTSNITAGNITGVSFLGAGNISITGNSSASYHYGNLNLTMTGTSNAEIVRANIADSDGFRILVGGTLTNQGFVEFATADDASEPIYFRQYTGGVNGLFTTATRTLTLLDATGNTILPGNLSVTANIAGANLSGTYIAGTLTTAYQPNITGVGTLANATFVSNGNITMSGGVSQLTGANLVSATYFTGNASLLATVTGANVTGFVANANIANTVRTPSQPNITLVGTLANLTVSGNIDSLAFANLNNLRANYVYGDFLPIGNNLQDLGSPTHRWRDLYLSGQTLKIGTQTISTDPALGTMTLSGSVVSDSLDVGTITATTLGGTLTTAVQDAITTVGILDGLSVSGAMDTGDITVNGRVDATIFSATGTITAAAVVASSLTLPPGGTIQAPGATTQLVFNDGGVQAAVAGMTFNKTTSLLTIQGNVAGGNLTTSGGVSATGNAQIGNINTAAFTSNTINTNSFISLGIVSSTGNVIAGNLNTSGFLSVNGNASVGNIVATTHSGVLVTVSGNITGANLLSGGLISIAGSATVASLNAGAGTIAGGILTATGNATAGNISTGGILKVTGQANLAGGLITNNSLINAGTGNVQGNVFVATLFSGNGSGITFINGTTVSGTVGVATQAGTVTASSQTAITQVGTLVGLSVTGAFSGADITSSGYVLTSVGTGIAATGTTLLTATQLTKQVNVIGTVSAGINDSVKLPAATTGMQIIIINTTAAICKVWPQSGGTIDTLAVSTAFSLGAGSRLMIIASNTTQWYTMVGVYG